MLGTLIRRVRGALGVAFTWGAIWAVLGSLVLEGIVDPHGEIVDMWPPLLAIMGGFFGLAFSLALTAVDGRRRFEELSFPRFVGLAVAVALGLSGIALVLGIFPNVAPAALRVTVVAGSAATLSAIAASATLGVARLAARAQSARLDAGEVLSKLRD